MFGALAFILWFALFTYDPSDPGFSQATAGSEVQERDRARGCVGRGPVVQSVRPARLPVHADGVLSRLDAVSRAEKTQQALTKTDFALRFGGFVATLVTSCALATLHFSPIGFNETAGGIVGQVVGHSLESVMKLLGASTLLFVLWIASISLFLGISWLSVMDRIGRWCLVGYEKARVKIGELRDRAEGRRQQAARQDVIEVEKKTYG